MSFRSPLKFLSTVLSLLSLLVLTTGCTSFGRKMKAWLSGKPPVQKMSKNRKSSNKMYSKAANYNKAPYRNYKRVTKKNFTDQAHLEPEAQSLWVMEGQGAYLFSQNVMRMIGDPITVSLDGDPKDQLETKAKVIKKLVAELEERRKNSLLRRLASKKLAKKGKGEAKLKEPEKEEPKKTTAGTQNKNEKVFGVKNVPTRVVERTTDGNYRVKGSQPFMIGKRQYRTIVTGIVRAADFNEQGVKASKLLDASFDIVSAKSSGGDHL